MHPGSLHAARRFTHAETIVDAGNICILWIIIWSQKKNPKPQLVPRMVQKCANSWISGLNMWLRAKRFTSQDLQPLNILVTCLRMVFLTEKRCSIFCFVWRQRSLLLHSTALHDVLKLSVFMVWFDSFIYQNGKMRLAQGTPTKLGQILQHFQGVIPQ